MSEIPRHNLEQAKAEELNRQVLDLIRDLNAAIAEGERAFLRGGSKEAIRLEEFAEKHPEEVISQITSIEASESIVADILLIAIHAIGSYDYDRGVELIRSHAAKFENVLNVEEEISYLLETHVSEMCLTDIDAAIEFALEKGSISRDLHEVGKQYLPQYLLYLARSTIVTKNPKVAIEVYNRGYEMLSPKFAEMEANESGKFMFYRKAASELIRTEPDKALELYRGTLSEPVSEHEREQFRDFEGLVAMNKIRLLFEKGDVAAGYKMYTKRVEKEGIHLTYGNLYELRRSIPDWVREAYDKAEERGSEEIKTFMRSIPDDVPGYTSALLRWFMHEVYKYQETLGHVVVDANGGLLEEYEKDFYKAYQDIPEFRAQGMFSSLRASDWTKQEKLDTYRQLEKIPERGKILSAVSPDFLPLDEMEQGERNRVVAKLFELHRKYKKDDLIFYNLFEYEHLIAALPPAEIFEVLEKIGARVFAAGAGRSEPFARLVDKLKSVERRSLYTKFIRSHPGKLFENHHFFDIPDDLQLEMFETLIKRRQYRYLLRSDAAYEGLNYTRETVLNKLFEKLDHESLRLFENSLSKLTDEERKDVEIPDDFRHKLLDLMAEDLTGALIMGAHKLRTDDHEFDPDSVQNGYVTFYRYPFADKSVEDNRFENLEKMTRVQPDFEKIQQSFLASKPGLVEMANVSEREREGFSDIPWAPALRRLIKIQARSANADNDPWKTELGPLFKMISMREFSSEEEGFSIHEAQDGEIFADFVGEFGPINAENLLYVYKQLRVSKTKEDLPDLSKSYLTSFLVERRFDALQETADILNELRQKRRQLIGELLADGEIPDSVYTELGQEIFTSVIGSTNWGRNDGGVVTLLSTWERTREDHTKVTELPSGYEEVDISIQKRARVERVTPEQEEVKQKVLSKKEFQRTFREFADGFHRDLGSLSLEQYEQKLKDDVLEFLATKISRLQDRLENIGSSAPGAMLVNLNKLEQQREFFEKLDTRWSVFPREGREIKIAQLMEDILAIGIKGAAADRLIKDLSINHIALVTKRRSDHAVISILSRDPDYFVENMVDHLPALTSFVNDFIDEHYLHPEQEVGHTDHAPFSNDLLFNLRRIWKLNQDKEKHPFRKTLTRLEEIDRGELIQKEFASVAMVPAHGALRIFSGDTGDACFTSKHENLARGEYPNLHAFTFVTGRKTPHERFVGSVLFIETKEDETGQDESVLVVRANNPRENLIQSVDEESLIEQTLEQAIELAKRRGIERVVVPLDPTSASCSNRPAVGSYYAKYFSRNKKWQLKNEPETNFNGYDNWDPNGDFPVVEIWSRDDGRVGSW